MATAWYASALRGDEPDDLRVDHPLAEPDGRQVQLPLDEGEDLAPR